MIRRIQRKWTGVPGFSNYIMSDEGKIRRVITAQGAQVGKDKKLTIAKQTIDENGIVHNYYVVSLRKGGKTYVKSVRKLIALAFGQNRKGYVRENKIIKGTGRKVKKEITNLITALIDRNGKELGFENTQWNMPYRGDRHWISKLTNEIVELIRNNQDMDLEDFVARYGKFGVSKKTIQAVMEGLTWRHRTEPFSSVTFPSEEDIDIKKG